MQELLEGAHGLFGFWEPLLGGGRIRASREDFLGFPRLSDGQVLAIWASTVLHRLAGGRPIRNPDVRSARLTEIATPETHTAVVSPDTRLKRGRCGSIGNWWLRINFPTFSNVLKCSDFPSIIVWVLGVCPSVFQRFQMFRFSVIVWMLPTPRWETFSLVDS